MTTNAAEKPEKKIEIKKGQKSIFQTFWKLHCCAKSLFFELEGQIMAPATFP